jgi:hypothetical protein
MISAPKQNEDYSPEESARRRDQALRVALGTPHKPHKPLGKKKRKAKPSAASGGAKR